MVDYSEAIFNALALTRKAHSECGFHLPSVILQLHIRRLRRLEKACKKYSDDESETDSTASESSDRHTPYPTSAPTRTPAPATQRRAHSGSYEHNQKRNRSPRNSGRSSSRQESPPSENTHEGRRSSPIGHRQGPRAARPSQYKDRAPTNFARRPTQKRKHPVNTRQTQEYPLQKRNSSAGQGRRR